MHKLGLFSALITCGTAFAVELDFSGAAQPEVKKLAGNFKFTEGPVWEPQGFWIFSDIPAGLLYKCTPVGDVEIFRSPSGHANGNALDREGRLVTCEHDRRVSRTEKDGTVKTLADRFEGKRLNSPNDLAIRSDGSVYFTDPPYGLKKREEAELDFCGVYRIAPTGELSLLTKDFAKPNGIAFSPDEKRLYIADSELCLIRGYDVQPDGSITNGRLFAEVKEPGKSGAPDGMKVDARGNLYVAGPGGVWVYTPEGKLLAQIPVPEEPANLCWGGDDRKTLFITARTGVYVARMNVAGGK